MITTKCLPTLTKLYQTVDIKFWHFLLHMILEYGELKMQVLAAKYPEFTSRHHIPHAYNRREGDDKDHQSCSDRCPWVNLPFPI
jgi:hypothetical protein